MANTFTRGRIPTQGVDFLLTLNKQGVNQTTAQKLYLQKFGKTYTIDTIAKYVDNNQTATASIGELSVSQKGILVTDENENTVMIPSTSVTVEDVVAISNLLINHLEDRLEESKVIQEKAEGQLSRLKHLINEL